MFLCIGWPNPFKIEFNIVIFIHYKPQIAVAILDYATLFFFSVLDERAH